MRPSDWDDPRLRAIGRRYAAEAFELADELAAYGADASRLLTPGKPETSSRPWDVALPTMFADALMALLLSLPRRHEKPGALGDNVVILKPGRSIEARVKHR